MIEKIEIYPLPFNRSDFVRTMKKINELIEEVNRLSEITPDRRPRCIVCGEISTWLNFGWKSYCEEHKPNH